MDIRYISNCQPGHEWVIIYDTDDPSRHAVSINLTPKGYRLELFTMGDRNPDHVMQLGEFKTLAQVLVRAIDVMGWYRVMLTPMPFISAFGVRGTGT